MGLEGMEQDETGGKNRGNEGKKNIGRKKGRKDGTNDRTK
jgi:hypothetical protein